MTKARSRTTKGNKAENRRILVRGDQRPDIDPKDIVDLVIMMARQMEAQERNKPK